MSDLAPEYIVARRVLLDALAALENHLDNLVLVGAQAVYHHTGSADLNVPLMTTDADLGDARTCDIRVAGPAALLTAKAIKIGERLEQADRQPDRLKEKDALDAFRLLQAIEVPDLVHGFEKHREDEYAAAMTAEALDILRAHGSAPQGRLARLAAAASQGDPTVAPAFAALVGGLLAAR